MKYVLIKRGDVKLLINEGLHIQPFIDHLETIEALAEDVSQYHSNLLSATREQGAELDARVRELTSKIGYKIVGVPFSNHDAELYALDKQLEYTVLELI